MTVCWVSAALATSLVDQDQPVDSSVLVHPDKGLRDGPAHLVLHGEAGPVPVDAAAKLPQLVVDGLAFCN